MARNSIRLPKFFRYKCLQPCPLRLFPLEPSFTNPQFGQLFLEILFLFFFPWALPRFRPLPFSPSSHPVLLSRSSYAVAPPPLFFPSLILNEMLWAVVIFLESGRFSIDTFRPFSRLCFFFASCSVGCWYFFFICCFAEICLCCVDAYAPPFFPPPNCPPLKDPVFPLWTVKKAQFSPELFEIVPEAAWTARLHIVGFRVRKKLSCFSPLSLLLR